MAVFAPKPCVNPFEKNENFSDFFNFFFLKPSKTFFALEYRKRHFPGLYCLKKKSWKTGHFWTKTVG